jgi:protein phosphatase
MVTEEEARVLPAKNLVTRALGASPDLEPEVHDYDVEPGDIVLMCSDGLTEMVSHFEIAGLINACGSQITESARRLVSLANEAGGRDNCSVILVRVEHKFDQVGAAEEVVEQDDEIAAMPSPVALAQPPVVNDLEP